MYIKLSDSEKHRIYSFYKASLKNKRYRNRKAAMEMTVRKFSIPYRVLRDIIEPKTAENIGIDAETYRQEQEAHRRKKAEAWQAERAALIAEGHMTEESTQNPHEVRNRVNWFAEHGEMAVRMALSSF